MRSIKFLCGLFLTSSAFAAGGDVHTWHTVSAEKGVWRAQLQMLNQGGSFVSRDGNSLTQFTVRPDAPKDYGFIFDKGDDFDVAYTMTLIQDPPKAFHFKSKTCVYVITAKGPAKPDIMPVAYNGAKCNWKVVPGVGEDFMVG